MDEPTTTIVLIVGAIVLIVGAIWLGLFLVGLALPIIAGAIETAVSLFAWAAEHGFIGVALYVILWVIATPLMLIPDIPDRRRFRGLPAH